MKCKCGKEHQWMSDNWYCPSCNKTKQIITDSKSIELIAYTTSGEKEHLEFDHWPTKDELPDAVRFDIAVGYKTENKP